MTRQDRYFLEWRKFRGLTQAEAAEAIALEGESRGFPRSSRKVPGTHPALSRLENGGPYNDVTLELVANVYECAPLDLLQVDPTLMRKRGDRVRAR